MGTRSYLSLLVLLSRTCLASPTSLLDDGCGVVAVQKIQDGGIGKDEIQSIDDPETVRVGEGQFQVPPIEERDMVLGVALEFEGKLHARAYPLLTLAKKEIVNDNYDGRIHWFHSNPFKLIYGSC